MSLAKKESSGVLFKDAGEGSMENNIKQLITEEAYTQISTKFPKLVPMILGVSVMEITDKDNAIGGAVIHVGGTRLTIPIIYHKGKVDATTFLYDEKQDTMLALTKKIISILTTPSSSIEGESFKPGLNHPFDSGNINSIFVPPKTYNPKIASSNGGLLFAAMENSELLKTAMIRNLEDERFRSIFEDHYGAGSAAHIESMELEKVSSFYDDSAAQVLFSRREIEDSEWIRKEAAIAEFGKNGFVISHGANTQTKSLEKTSSVSTALKKIVGSEVLESIPANKQGVFTVYSLEDLKPIDVIIARQPGGGYIYIGGIADELGGENLDGNPIIGSQKNISETSLLNPIDDIGSGEGGATIIVIDEGEIYCGLKISWGKDSITKSLGGLTIATAARGASVVKIEKGSNASPILLGSTLYVGDKNVRIAKREEAPCHRVIRMRDLERAHGQHEKMVKVAFDGAEYVINGSAHSRTSLVKKLTKEGFDKNSIYGLVKTAERQGSVELAEVNAKLDMLANLVMNLAGKVESSGLAQAQAQPSMLAPAPEEQAPPQGLAQAQAPQDQNQEPMMGTAMQDPNSGMPSQQQMAEQDQAMQNQATQDQQLLQQNQPPAPMDQYAAAGANPPQAQQSEEAQMPLQDGMNTAIDPAVLATLAELKDSNVMDVGLISVMANNETMNQVMNEYKGDILAGASSVGRILLNALVKQDELSNDVGEKKYEQLVRNLRTIYIKISDLYADIMKMGLESDGQVEI